jgi:hypothetical protein
VTARFDDHGVALELASEVGAADSSSADQSVVVVPPVSVKFSSKVGIVPLSEKEPLVWIEARVPISKCISYSSDTLPAQCEGYADESKVHLQLPPGWRADKYPTQALVPEGAVTQFDDFTLHPPPLHDGDKLQITASAAWNGKDYTEGFRRVGTNYFTPPANYRAAAVDLQFPPHLVVGYVKGTGDEVAEYLRPLLGGHIIDIPMSGLTSDNLERFDAVILGVRAYTAHHELAGKGSQPLIDYARNGGVVILQYNNGRFGDAEAPYPITTPGSSGDHAHDVVDEDQPVTLLAPDSPLLTWPNRITAADFDHWVAERGHGFAGSWSSEYVPLLETHDPGQPSQQGGLLLARVGKGYYIYCGLALYRQLPEGVPGAYRLLANLISASKNPGLQK